MKHMQRSENVLMTARRRRVYQMRNSVDRSSAQRPVRQENTKVDVLKYSGAEIRAGAICLARQSYQIQRGSLVTPQLCRRRAGAIAFEEQFTREHGSRSCMSARSAHKRCRQNSSAYCEKTSTANDPCLFVHSLLRTAHVFL